MMRSQLSAPIGTTNFYLSLLHETDFDDLYAVASDPLLWEQHPERDRWRKDVFVLFFQSALVNDLGCFVIREKSSDRVVGSTRFYGLDELGGLVRIGFTFIERSLWGTSANAEIKNAMLARCFGPFKAVLFDIAPSNHRSIGAANKLGAIYSETLSPTKAVYRLPKSHWIRQS